MGNRSRKPPTSAQPPRAPRPFRVLIRVSAGWACIVLGLAGLFLPVLQGLLLLVLGIALLAPYVPFFHRLRERIYSRFPRTRRFTKAIHRRMHHWTGDF